MQLSFKHSTSTEGCLVWLGAAILILTAPQVLMGLFILWLLGILEIR
jgi:hypothetical protein